MAFNMNMPIQRTLEERHEGKILYRYYDGLDPSGVILLTDKFPVVHETKCFYTVVSEHDLHTYNSCKEHDRELPGWMKVRKIGKDVNITYARICKKQALRDYKKRKQKQIKHCQRGLNTARRALSALENTIVVSTEELNMGKIPEHNSLNLIWE